MLLGRIQGRGAKGAAVPPDFEGQAPPPRFLKREIKRGEKRRKENKISKNVKRPFLNINISVIWRGGGQKKWARFMPHGGIIYALRAKIVCKGKILGVSICYK